MVIYSHGMYSWRQCSSRTNELLASNGFVVFSCDHYPSAMLTRHYDPKGDLVDVDKYDNDLPEGIDPGTQEEKEFYNKGNIDLL